MKTTINKNIVTFCYLCNRTRKISEIFTTKNCIDVCEDCARDIHDEFRYANKVNIKGGK